MREGAIEEEMMDGFQSQIDIKHIYMGHGFHI
jgi:hypothetical protein